MVEIMKIVSNEFLLDIARDYSKDIMAVLIYEAPVEKKIKAAVFKDKTSFVIIIDETKCRCTIQTLHSLYHEIAHILKHHHVGLENLSFIERAIRENEADLWAAREMGMLDVDGGVESSALHCLPCCQYGYNYCARENGYIQLGAIGKQAIGE